MPLLRSLVRRVTGPKCPVDAAQKSWIETRLRWLQMQFGSDRLEVPILKPTLKIFPQTWNGSIGECRELLDVLCEYMEVPRESIELSLAPGAKDPLRHHLPNYESSHSGAAGAYHGRTVAGKFRISVSGDELRRPASLVATICHELGHVLLLGSGRVSRDEDDHEPMTDLLTVYFGAGIFTANAAFEFTQWTSVESQGWQTRTHGYMNEPQLGYALACYAFLRSERSPQWREHIAGNVRPYFDDALHFLMTTRDTTLLRLATDTET